MGNIKYCTPVHGTEHG